MFPEIPIPVPSFQARLPVITQATPVAVRVDTEGAIIVLGKRGKQFTCIPGAVANKILM